MAKKKTKKKKSGKKEKKVSVIKKDNKIDLRDDRDIAMDFAVKIYKKFEEIIKAVVLFGSTTKQNASSSSDIDIIILIDDASIKWDQELIAWYREELSKLVSKNQYNKEVHITTTRMTTWWNDLMKGDPVVINVLRYGEALVDVGGFFNPLKALLAQGRINSTPEAIHNALQRAPYHFARSKQAELNAIEGLFWAMVDSAQAALMAAQVSPPSYEHISSLLKQTFVDRKRLKIDYVKWFDELYSLHKQIEHGKITDLKGVEIDKWQERTDDFIGTMAKLVNEIVNRRG